MKRHNIIKNRFRNKKDFFIFINQIKGFLKKYKKLLILIFVLLILIFSGLVIYNKISSKIESLNRELEETKAQAVMDKKISEDQLSQQEKELETAREQANQEEIEKNEAKRELAEQEMKEQELNEDKDNDGLTYREEISYGTSDLNNDSDEDGIIDGKDVHPAGGGRNIPQTFSWEYNDTIWTFTTSILEDWYDYYKAIPRNDPTNTIYITAEDSTINYIADTISSKAKEEGYCNACFAASFIQSLPYVDDVYTGYDEYPKYPIETLFEKNGDCEDTSYLTASIIAAMNIGVKLVLLPGHMAVAAWADCKNSGTYYKIEDKCYYYIETTGDGFSLGEIPDSYAHTEAILIDIYSGDRISATPQYKKPCYSSSDFIGYFTDGVYIYSDNQCNRLINCVPYEDLYYNVFMETFYWDGSCLQKFYTGCLKSTIYSGYFTDGSDYYYNSACTNKARICRDSGYGDYWDGYSFYWDANCTQKVLSWCSESIYNPGYFFNSIDSDYYYDNQCNQKVYE